MNPIVSWLDSFQQKFTGGSPQASPGPTPSLSRTQVSLPQTGLLAAGASGMPRAAAALPGSPGLNAPTQITRPDLSIPDYSQDPMRQQTQLQRDARKQALIGDIAQMGQGLYLASQRQYQPMPGWSGARMPSPELNLASLAIALQQPGRPTPFGGFEVY